jgi:hypothetical protein
MKLQGMNATLPVAIPQQAIADFCARNHMRRLSVFGSILTDRFRGNSDIDMLVEFETGHVPGLFELSGMEIELSEMLGRKVDLRTPAELSHYFRNTVVATALPQYERPAKQTPEVRL